MEGEILPTAMPGPEQAPLGPPPMPSSLEAPPAPAPIVPPMPEAPPAEPPEPLPLVEQSDVRDITPTGRAVLDDATPVRPQSPLASARIIRGINH
jgi:hypothetical protein